MVEKYKQSAFVRQIHLFDYLAEQFHLYVVNEFFL
jgi:hypothetical protein